MRPAVFPQSLNDAIHGRFLLLSEDLYKLSDDLRIGFAILDGESLLDIQIRGEDPAQDDRGQQQRRHLALQRGALALRILHEGRHGFGFGFVHSYLVAGLAVLAGAVLGSFSLTDSRIGLIAGFLSL